MNKVEKNLELLKFRYGTWKEVARRLGVSESTLYRWRKGITKPNKKNYEKLVKAKKKRAIKIVIYGVARTK